MLVEQTQRLRMEGLGVVPAAAYLQEQLDPVKVPEVEVGDDPAAAHQLQQNQCGIALQRVVEEQRVDPGVAKLEHPLPEVDGKRHVIERVLQKLRASGSGS